MEQNYISDDVFEQIKDFKHHNLSEEQKLLIDKLIPKEELNQRYKEYGLCEECKQPNTSSNWCQSCMSKQFQNCTSGNSDIDRFIQESQLNAKRSQELLEWIEYDRFENIEHIAKGGFGQVYKAKWKDGDTLVALKCLYNSKEVTLEFLNEITSHLLLNTSAFIIKCFGITKDPKTNDFMMVMQYAEGGSLRQKLNTNFNSMNWFDKFNILRNIAEGLRDIHRMGLIHKDFHSNNILNSGTNFYISGLGLCRPAGEASDNKNVYGVLPYVAPEVLRGKVYTQASDIYGFGIIIYEVFCGLFPYNNMTHDALLAVKICEGFRPEFNIKVPQLLEDVFKQCVDEDPLKRPTAEYLREKFDQLHDDALNDTSEISKQIKEADEFNISV